MRRLLALGLGVAALWTGCGGDTDDYKQVDTSELSPRLQEAQRKLTDAGYEAIGADLLRVDPEVRVVLVDPGSDDALVVVEGTSIGKFPQIPADVVNVETTLLCGHITIGGPDGDGPHDHPWGEARKRSGICRR